MQRGTGTGVLLFVSRYCDAQGGGSKQSNDRVTAAREGLQKGGWVQGEASRPVNTYRPRCLEGTESTKAPLGAVLQHVLAFCALERRRQLGRKGRHPGHSRQSKLRHAAAC